MGKGVVLREAVDAGSNEEDLVRMLEQVLGGAVDDIGVEAHRHRDLAALLARGVQGGGVAKMETREARTRRTRKTTSGICRRATGRM